MTNQEKEYFDALTIRRSKLAEDFEDPAFSGVKDSVVDKYTDQAHFIYELLQNADDAKASYARFVLYKDKLIFVHNGSRHFTVSNPVTEREDKSNNQLGDINAITSVGHSSKTVGSIGKFGVGFKAVFQYTSTPYIYDTVFRFKIENFIVPILLESDYPDRSDDETLFVFPFNHSVITPEKAYEDISDKLAKLSYPLLFLGHLKSIEFEYENVIGLYEKKITETRLFDKTCAEHIVLTQNKGENIYDEKLWLFSRPLNSDADFENIEHNLYFSVGFFTDESGHLIPKKVPAFCYFPTKHNTNLNFMIHAPFLLNDSREGIRAGLPHNESLIRDLAVLAADSLEYLRDIGIEKSIRIIDDDFIYIIPTSETMFSDESDKDSISFLPFYNKIKEKLSHATILPTKNGYTSSIKAYWASTTQLPQLFNDEQLSDIVENIDAHWVFTSFSRDEFRDNIRYLFEYIDSLVRGGINEDNILGGRSREHYVRYGVKQYLENIKGITPEFIEKQSIEWLHAFYKWIDDSAHRRDVVRLKAVLLDQNGVASPVFDDKKKPVLFLPVKDITGYRVVHPQLLANDNTRLFIDHMGVKEPSLKDQIYNIILPQYVDGADIDTAPHFMMFFNYFCECPNEESRDFIELIKNCEFLTYFDPDDGERYRGAACSMYMPTTELKAYFSSIMSVKYIALEEYKELVGEGREKQLIYFLNQLGVKSEIGFIEQEPDYSMRDDLPTPNYTRYRQYKERVIYGCKNIIEYIEKNKDSEKSIILWNTILRVIDKTIITGSYSNLLSLMLRGECRYFYKIARQISYESSDALLLKNSKWLLDSDGQFVSANEITAEQLSSTYPTNSDSARELIDFLCFKQEIEENVEDAEDSHLTDEQREKIALADKLREYGITDDEDLEEFLEYKRRKESRIKQEGVHDLENEQAAIRSTENIEESGIEAEVEKIVSEVSGDQDSVDNNRVEIQKSTKSILKDIVRRTREKSSDQIQEPIDEDADEDEFMPSPVDYGKKIERAKDKSAAEVEKIEQYQRLQDVVMSSERYSYAWFNALLEMESLNSGEANQNSKEISICFSSVEKDPGTERTLVLKHPNRYIPQYMEDLADIPMVLHMADSTKTVAIEVASVVSYTLRVKMKNASDIDGVDLSSVTSITIDAQSPAFLIEELRKQFSELGYDDDYNMQDNLCENIQFVFGPPGTGKTTYLAKNVLLPMMNENSECKVLVLTPTNKSADVLTSRIMEVSGSDHSYEDWLVRFGTTIDEKIENSPVYKDKTFDIRTLNKNVTVTTIARFPYDFFMPLGARIFLSGINWDYIVIDEASMIPIANIVFPLYKKTPKKFIVAGDPFQIEPITSVDLWKNENIYTLVHLDSFVEPKTIPYQYDVKLLTTQYRSVPGVGSIFSRFAYGGILKHYRSTDSQRKLKLGDALDIKTLNIIKFPVSKYESIYRCKRLQHSSSYQVYSALFTYEFVCFLSKKIAENNSGELFRIGVIAPYRAQSDMIDKLLASEKLPGGIEVQVGTIHGFQGDECDVIFSVFNTPPKISASKEMFLNKKNIINVSISRARDYLFVVMPDDDTEDISNLRLVNRVEKLITESGDWKEFKSSDLEELMFGDPKYLENNAFSTSHQSVNVYGLPEKRYEVRTEDTAVDVQVHKNAASNDDLNKQTDIKADTSEITFTTKNVMNEDIIYEGTKTSCENVSEKSYYNDDVVPAELKNDAIFVPVRGEMNGWCHLVPYRGKLSDYTNKSTQCMFIPLVSYGIESLISVTVIKEERIVFITSDIFEFHQKELCTNKGIELRKK